MKAAGIYRIVHIATGREYVGQSQNIEHRWKAHRRRLNGGYHHCHHLQAAWLKYGAEAFAFDVIELCPIPGLDAAEQRHLDARNPTFNIARVAGSTRGVVPSEATRRKLAEAGRGRKHTPEAKEKIRQAHVGRKFTEEHRRNLCGRVDSPEKKAKMLAANLGRKLTEEHKAKLRVHLIGRKNSPETIAKRAAKLRGQKRTDEQRARMRAAALARRKGR